MAEYYATYNYDLRVDLQTSPVPPIGDLVEGQIRAVPGIRDAQAALISPASASNAQGDTLDTIIVISVDETNPFLDFRTIAGATAFSRADGVWVGNNTARLLNVKPGDWLTLRAAIGQVEVEVLGVVSNIIGTPIFVPRSLMEQWLPGGVFRATSVFARVEDGQLDTARNALATVPGVVAVEVFDEFKGDLDTYMLFFRVGTLIFGGFGYVLTLAVLFNTVNASLRERQDELAVLRALGHSIREIAVIIILELLLMTLLGAIVGIPIGREAGYYLQRSYDSTAFNSLTNMTLSSYILGSASLLLIVLVSVIPGLRAVQKVDLGQVSKSQSI